MRIKKTITWVAVTVVLGGAAYGLYHHFKSPPARPQYLTARVRRGAVTAKVTASGTLSARVTVQVGSQVSGRISEILVDYNDTVKKDQVIARIDPQLFVAAVRQARASLLTARGELAKSRVDADLAKRQLASAKKVFKSKILSQNDLDAAQAKYGEALAQVEIDRGKVAQAREALRQAEINDSHTTVRSPINGVVLSRNVDVGQTVAASFQTPTLFSIAQDLTKMQVDTSVAEADIGKLRPGMKAQFTVDAYGSQPFEGTVRQIRFSSTTVDNVVTYNAVIDVANPGLRLKPGMTANVTFVLATRKQALLVPNAAFRYRPHPGAGSRSKPGPRSAPFAKASAAPAAHGRVLAGMRGGPPGAALPTGARPRARTVYVLHHGHPQPIRIHTGITDGSVTEVLGGALHPGDEVIVGVSSGKRPSSGMRRRHHGPPHMF